MSSIEAAKQKELVRQDLICYGKAYYVHGVRVDPRFVVEVYPRPPKEPRDPGVARSYY